MPIQHGPQHPVAQTAEAHVVACPKMPARPRILSRKKAEGQIPNALRLCHGQFLERAWKVTQRATGHQWRTWPRSCLEPRLHGGAGRFPRKANGRP
eukprot:8789448-Pyramimonas_sp.AAC.1